MVVSIPVTHPDAPPRNDFVRGQYESVEMIREIPISSANSNEGDDSETNPVEWIMITRSDPGGSVPRFMVERNTPSSIVQDAGKFLQWACAQDFSPQEDEKIVKDTTASRPEPHRALSNNAILAGVGTSIVDDPRPVSFRRPSQQVVDKGGEPGILESLAHTVEYYVPDALNPLHRVDSSSSSSSSSISSGDSFASAEQFNTADEGDDPTRSTLSSDQSIPIPRHKQRQLEKLERKRQQAAEKLAQMKQTQTKETETMTLKTQRELEKATEKHNREKKKQEERYAKELRKLEARRERDTKKLLAKQQKEAEKNNLLKTQRERDEWKERAELAEKENQLIKEQILEVQRENTLLVAKMGKVVGGEELLRGVKEDMEGKGRMRASSRASAKSAKSARSGGTTRHEKTPSGSGSHLSPE